ncbi:hypothetical protein GCM10023238_39490 [Streptomyces heliomycini]
MRRTSPPLVSAFSVSYTACRDTCPRAPAHFGGERPGSEVAALTDGVEEGDAGGRRAQAAPRSSSAVVWRPDAVMRRTYSPRHE